MVYLIEGYTPIQEKKLESASGFESVVLQSASYKKWVPSAAVYSEAILCSPEVLVVRFG